jgi:hypothetical protein
MVGAGKVPLALALASCLGAAVAASGAAEPRRLVLIAGADSHGFGAHEHGGGFRLLAELLNASPSGVQATVCEGWPAAADLLAGAAAVAFYGDGGGGSIVSTHLAELQPLMARGTGLAIFHWALDVPGAATPGGLLEWAGGYYETHWSVNPFWTATFAAFPEHPVTRGVRPFALADEWYYNMRFAQDMAGVTPVLTALPPDSTRAGPDGPYSGNPAVRARRGIPEHLAWVYERPEGGRSFGFTGGHNHWNWAHDDLRRLVLNALVWITGAEVPANGVASAAPTLEQLVAVLRRPAPQDWDRAGVERLLAEWQTETAPGGPKR